MYPTAIRLQGSAAFVTGGAQGIGLGICRALAGAGVRLAIVDIDKDALSRARSELGTLTAVETFVLDVRDRARYAQVADEAEAALGPIVILCNNAGVGGGDPVSGMSYAMWDWMLGINVGGIINGVQTFAPRMIRRGMGHIVNTASGAGLATDPAWQVGFMYPTTKYAVVGMSEALRAELAEFGVGVSVLCPGPVATNIQSNSARARPAENQPPSAEQLAVLDLGLHQRGLSPDVVGAMVLDGIRNNEPYILTDRMFRGAVAARFARILQAFPQIDTST